MVLAVTFATGAGDAEASRYQLGTDFAGRLMREGILRHPSVGFQAGYARRVRCNKRISDIRLKCRMIWFVSDTVFYGRGTIWLTFPEHRAYWNYAYRIVGLNEYCALVEHRPRRECVHVYVAR
jgi:hypothetical protein